MRRVLVVEDEPNISEAIRFILTRRGWAVEVTADGNQAVARAQGNPPDLMILDLMLPGISGFEILRDLRAHPDTMALPVLMLTAKGQAADREQAERLGVTCFMTKPFANADVIAAVDQLAAP